MAFLLSAHRNVLAQALVAASLLAAAGGQGFADTNRLAAVWNESMKQNRCNNVPIPPADCQQGQNMAITECALNPTEVSFMRANGVLPMCFKGNLISVCSCGCMDAGTLVARIGRSSATTSFGTRGANIQRSSDSRFIASLGAEIFGSPSTRSPMTSVRITRSASWDLSKAEWQERRNALQTRLRLQLGAHAGMSRSSTRDWRRQPSLWTLPSPGGLKLLRLLKCRFDDRHSLAHHRVDGRRHRVRQEVRRPNEPAAHGPFRHDMRSAVMMRQAPTDARPDETARRVVNADNDLARLDPVGEGHEPRPFLHRHVRDEAGHETRVQGPDVAEGIPSGLWARIDQNFLADRRHIVFLFVP